MVDMRTVPGFILGVREDGGWVERGGVFYYFDSLDYVVLRVVAVGRSTYGYDNKYYSTEEVKVGDLVLAEREYVIFEYYDGEKMQEIYKIPIDKILAIIN